MRQLELPGGTPLPVLGLGTWRMGESAGQRAAEIAAVRSAFDLGYRLIDTAEMYGDGGAEEVVGRALGDALRAGTLARDDVLIVSKVYPHNASRRGTLAACDRSLGRLGIGRIDLYLLHWRGAHPLRDTVVAMHELQAAGKIGHWGVSNFDVADMDELMAVPGASASDASGCATDQVYFAASERSAEFGLLPWLRRRAMPLMAYSPVDQGGLAGDATLSRIGAARGLSAAQVALAWVVGRPGVIAIPKASSERHLRENLAAADVVLTADELQQIDARFAPPRRKKPLAMN